MRCLNIILLFDPPNILTAKIKSLSFNLKTRLLVNLPIGAHPAITKEINIVLAPGPKAEATQIASNKYGNAKNISMMPTPIISIIPPE